jgi:multidrug efflux pump subunit AcrA (membrane-fusion protein)
MFASGEILSGKVSDALLVPKDAVDDRKGVQSVFTVGPKNVAKRHIVKIVRENREFAQLDASTDLKAGDVVVTQGHNNIQDGALVETHDVGRLEHVAN